MTTDERYMRLVLSLARRGLGKTYPNPMVGALLVKRGQMIGKGYHRRAGLAHAEIEVLRQAQQETKGSVLYVNLEPCCHWGKTPPCTEALIRAGISRVVIAMRDPNPLVNGKGISQLLRAGIKVVEGVLEKEAYQLNEVFVKWITRKLPFVTVKVAQSLDGKIATRTGESRWITGESARRYVQQLRSRADGILVGIRTILKDDPLLNVRKRKVSPIKIILDPHLRIPLTARVFSKESPEPIILVTSLERTRSAKAKELCQLNDCQIWPATLKEGRFDLKPIFQRLAKIPLCHLLVEGGGETIAALLEAKLVDRVVWFLAPRMIGGRSAPTSVEGEGVQRLSQGTKVKEIRVRRFGEDLCLEGRISVHRNH